MTHMLSIYRKFTKNIKLTYFLKWKYKINKILVSKLQHFDFAIQKENVHERLFNDYKIKELMLSELEKRFNSYEAEKHPFTPTINHVNFQYKTKPSQTTYPSQSEANITQRKQQKSVSLKLENSKNSSRPLTEREGTLYHFFNHRSAKNIINYNHPLSQPTVQNKYKHCHSNSNYAISPNELKPATNLFNKPNNLNSSFSTISILSTRNKTKRHNSNTIVINTPVSTRLNKHNSGNNINYNSLQCNSYNNNLNSSRPFINTSSSDAPVYLKSSFHTIQKNDVNMLVGKEMASMKYSRRPNKKTSGQTSSSNADGKITNYSTTNRSKLDSVSMHESKGEKKDFFYTFRNTSGGNASTTTGTNAKKSASLVNNAKYNQKIEHMYTNRLISPKLVVKEIENKKKESINNSSSRKSKKNYSKEEIINDDSKDKTLLKLERDFSTSTLNININNNNNSTVSHSPIANYKNKNLLEISSGVINESLLTKNVTNQQKLLNSNKTNNYPDVVTLQTLSDSKLFELANHYITTDESLEKYQCMSYTTRKGDK